VAYECDLGVTEVNLDLTRGVGQGDGDLGGPEPPGADGIIDNCQAALIVVLGLEPVEDPQGGVPLLLEGLLVVFENQEEDGKEGIENRCPLRLVAAVARRLGVLEDLAERLPVDVVLSAGGTPAEAISEDATADLGPFSMSVYTLLPHDVCPRAIAP
jgi:hypothetical protein